MRIWAISAACRSGSAGFAVVFPALVLNYLGQGAPLMANSGAIQNPFYLLAPGWAHYPMVAFATVVTVIASQSIISGAYSLTQRAIQLGFLPRMRVLHTASHEKGLQRDTEILDFSRAEPEVQIHLPPADSPSLSRSRFRASRTRAFPAGVRARLTTGSAETRQAFHSAPTGGNVSAGPYSSTTVPLMRPAAMP